MPPAVAAAGIAAAGAIGGGLLSASATKSAAKTAASAETQAAQLNVAAAKDFYAKNTANLSPWLQSGAHANALVDSFLYGPQSAAPQPATAAGPAHTFPTGNVAGALANSGGFGAVFGALPNAGGNNNPATAEWATGVLNAVMPTIGPKRTAKAMSISDPVARLNYIAANLHSGQESQVYRSYIQANPRPTAQTAPVTAQPAQAGGQPQNALSGYDAFVNSPYYQFPLQEGYRALNHGLASHGMLESGNALKSAARYGQDYASGRMGEFINLAENQSNRGLQAGGAIAGVGVNALNTTTAANSAAGNAAANRAIAGGVANANLYSTIGSALGNVAGSIIAPSSYRGY